MRSTLSYTILSLLLFACEGDAVEDTIHLSPGTYQGYFIRSNSYSNYEAVAVTLTFRGNRFSGSSAHPWHPAICEGTYSISGSSITFINECPWTADFDWTLILDGKFTLRLHDGALEMTKSIGDQTDTYRLMPQ